LNLAYRTTEYEPSLYCAAGDETYSLDLYSHWADDAWSQQAGSCAAGIASPDYSLGFHAGFVDYCYAGGTGEPPPMPPRKYWNVSWRFADNKVAVRDWFEGYRHGARVAREGGYRESAVVQASTGLRNGRVVSNQLAAESPEFGQSSVGPVNETLPVPAESTSPDQLEHSVPVEPVPPQASPAALPELRTPPLGNRPDGAAIKGRDHRVIPTSLSMAAVETEESEASASSATASKDQATPGWGPGQGVNITPRDEAAPQVNQATTLVFKNNL
jgi:hypothetical protein